MSYRRKKTDPYIKWPTTVKYPYVPRPYRRLYSEVVEGKRTPLHAIKAFCQRCCNYGPTKENREKIANCPHWQCPLYVYRDDFFNPNALRIETSEINKGVT